MPVPVPDPPAASLARSTAVMAVGTVLSRLTGFGRDFALAYAIGFSFFSDSYNLANTTPNILYELVLGGVLSAALLPVFVQRLAGDGAGEGDDEGDDGGWRAVSAVVTLALVAAVAISIAVAIVAPWIIRAYTFGNDSAALDEQRRVATFLLRLFAPQVAFLGFFTVATAVLNARHRFAAPMFTPVLNNLIAIAVILMLPRIAGDVAIGRIADDRSALLWLGLGTTTAYGVQAIGLGVALRRAGARLRPVWDLHHEAVRSVLRLSGWTIGFVIANQLALFAVYALATDKGGDLSAYQAAFRFFQLPHAVLTVSIMSALQPELAQRWHSGAVADFRHRLAAGVRLTAGLLVPAAAGYALLAGPIIRVVLEHGELATASARATGDTLAIFALGLPGFSIFLLLTRAYQAMQDTRSVFVLYLGENAANVVLAVALYPAHGVRGLAAAYGLAYTGAAIAATVHMARRLGGFEGTQTRSTLVRIGAGAAAMSAMVAIVVRVLPHGSFVADSFRIAAAIVTGLAVYAAAARTLHLDDVLAALPRRRGAAAGSLPSPD